MLAYRIRGLLRGNPPKDGPFRSPLARDVPQPIVGLCRPRRRPVAEGAAVATEAAVPSQREAVLGRRAARRALAARPAGKPSLDSFFETRGAVRLPCGRGAELEWVVCRYLDKDSPSMNSD